MVEKDVRMRSSNQELPVVDEVLQLIHERESQRRGADHTWIDSHPEVFAPFRGVLSSMGIADPFALNRHITTKDGLARLIGGVEDIKAEFLAKIDSNPPPRDQLVAMYRELAREDDQLRVADAIFVFGAPSNARIDKAVELYQNGLSERIVISGRGPNWQDDIDQTEASRMAVRAVELGVPESALQLEHQALTIPDNVKRTLDMFDESSFAPTKVIIVASAFVMLRAYIDWKRFSNDSIEVMCAAPPLVDMDLSADRWFTNEKGRNTVINEYAKIIHEAGTNSYLGNTSL